MKDHDSLLAVATAMPDTTFVMAGAGTESLAKLPNVIALGLRRDMPALYAAADIALSTSAFGEGFPNTIGEAMATGVPILATDVGDSKRIIGKAGLTAPPRDVGAMTATLRRLLDEPHSARRARGEAARQRIEQQYSLDRAVAAFDALHLHGTLPDPARQDMSE
jgi:glycosyltransferase involved in cell wall biosynthesis